MIEISKKLDELRNYHFSSTSFENLMQSRIYRVLVICSNYDFYMLEQDGRIDEQIFNEYVSLNLRYPPVFIQADTVEKAYKILGKEDINLIIIMLSIGGTAAFDLSREVKDNFPEKPIVVLTPFSREVKLWIAKEDLSAIDHIFCWLGDTDLLMAIIKLIEDKMNVKDDVEKVGVQTILLVEDAIRFYSAYLPNMYKIILTQSINFMSEGLNAYNEMLQMRGRPKILLATTYEEALKYYETYKENMLGIISDIKYKHNGLADPDAGFRLFKHVRTDKPDMPFLLQSSELKNKQRAQNMGIDFLFKQSKTLSLELRDYIFHNLAFGDFIFRDAAGNEIDRAANLRELQHKMSYISAETLRHHFDRNDFSRWLVARALFPLAEMLKYLTLDDFSSPNEARSYILKAISGYRLNKSRGVIAKFQRESYDEYIIFSRIGEGSLGGKARGLAFIDAFLKRHKISHLFSEVVITIPRSVVLTTNVFDQFMIENQLYDIALSDKSDQEILDRFVAAHFPDEVRKDLEVFLNIVQNPVAVRSSSVLEDSHYQPFAGVYSTYMIPCLPHDKTLMLNMLIQAIKCVYASVYYQSSKSYMEATANVIDEEKMGIILQEVCGSTYKNLFFPTLSGVARSINFYPISPEKPEDGIAKIALGLGKIIVGGGQNMRFSPQYPNKILQLSSPNSALRESQKHFYALDLNPDTFKPSLDDGINIKKIKVKDIDDYQAFKYVASTYDLQNNKIIDSLYYQGKKIVTFSNILKHNAFPLARILQTLLHIGQREMNTAIEIEFAVNLDTPADAPAVFDFLQIRPIVENTEVVNFKLSDIKPQDSIIWSEQALGNGIIRNIRDIIYVDPEGFEASKNKMIAQSIESLNRQFLKQKENYILIGPGRWGSSDPWLGIPIKWSQISAARLIVESGLAHYRVDPSQGTHFFQNLTSFRVGYFTINPYLNDGYWDIDYLNQQTAVFEDQYIRHIRLDEPVCIMVDGQNNQGVVLKNANTKLNTK